jgi:hypothetical protein
MPEERAQHADRHDHDNKLPKDVLNSAQDANSFNDPLEQQLEKSKHMNLDNESQTLDALKQKREDLEDQERKEAEGR